jgi:TP901 family phage tail tape measure protein
MQLNEAAETRIRLIKMWGTEMFRLVSLNDQLVKVEQMFTMTTEQLTTAMNTSGAVAKLAGLSFAQTAVAIGELVAAGIEASTAGTTLRNVLKALVAPSEGVKTAINELGLSWITVSNLPIDERMSLVAGKILALGTETAMLNAAFEIFGLRGSNVAAILDTLSVSWDGQAASILAATGNAALAAQVFRENLHTRLVELGNAITQVFRENLHTRLVELGNAITAGMIRFGEWVAAGNNARNLAIILGGAILGLTVLKNADTIATMRNVIAEKAGVIWKGIKTVATWMNIRAIRAGIINKIVNNQLLKMETRGEMEVAMATGISTGAKVGAGIASVIYSLTLGMMTRALKAAGAAAKGLWKALGPIGIIAMIVGAALAYIMSNTDMMAQLMLVLNPLLDDFADIWGMLGEVLDMLVGILGPILKIFGGVLMSSLGMLVIPLKLVVCQFKIMMPILMLILKPVMILVQAFGDLLESTGWLTKFLGWMSIAMEKVGDVINVIVDGIIWLVNWLGKLFGVDWGLDVDIEDTATTEEREAERAEQERLEAEAAIDKQKALDQELDFGETVIVDTDATTSPTTVPETGTDGSGTSGSGYGSGGGGGVGPLSITIYISAMLDDVINTESFAEYVAQYAMAEVAKSRGTGMI